MESYPFLLKEESETEQVIVWDLSRTFPAHDFFKDAKGDGQRLLYNLNKAYSIYDSEIGYCQGMSFISAVLLLHVGFSFPFSPTVVLSVVCLVRLFMSQILPLLSSQKKTRSVYLWPL